jgi:hypothetical protein
MVTRSNPPPKALSLRIARAMSSSDIGSAAAPRRRATAALFVFCLLGEEWVG